MRLLTINSGSSSVKFSVFSITAGSTKREPEMLLDGELSGVGTSASRLKVTQDGKSSEHVTPADTPEAGIPVILDALETAGVGAPDAVGYRVVHPGAKLDRHQRITDEVLRDLEEASSFAPLHDPAVLQIIRELMKKLPAIPHFACFDTIFHQTMPDEAKTLPIPQSFRQQGVRKYGFHGLSCESIVRRMRLTTHRFPQRAVIAHLGSGCSVTALIDGKSVDTTMGLTPDGGVVMGTRSGDLDPGLLLYLIRHAGGADNVEKILNHDAGMVALSGMKNDVKAMRKAAAEDGNVKAKLALQVFCRSVRKAIGGYSWLLGGLDAIIFSGGIGEHDAQTRSEILAGLEQVGVKLAQADAGDGPRRISEANSPTAVWVVPAEEDLVIALHVNSMMQQQ